MSTVGARRETPGLPGAAYVPGRRVLASRVSPSSASRPPLPTTITLIALGPDPLYYRLVALGADADHAQRRPDLGFDEADEVLRGLGEIYPHPGTRDVHAPAGKRLVDRPRVVE